jgi:hypothetical protein
MTRSADVNRITQRSAPTTVHPLYHEYQGLMWSIVSLKSIPTEGHSDTPLALNPPALLIGNSGVQSRGD